MNDTQQSNLWPILIIGLMAYLTVGQGQCPITPPTPIDPPPLTQPGLRVMVVYETNDLTSPWLVTIRDSDASRRLLETKTVVEGGSPCFRFFDADTSYADSPQWVKDAMALPRKSLPWLVVSNGKTGYSGPCPQTLAEFVALVEKYSK